jgi:murein DD-endopeptidase MepM/ murein hydrolase activator NlpD
MADPNRIPEPPIDPLADTNPSMTIRQVPLHPERRPGGLMGLVSLLLAAGLTLGALVILLVPGGNPSGPAPTATPQEIPVTAPPVQDIAPTLSAERIERETLLPTAAPSELTTILNVPLRPVRNFSGAAQVVRNMNDPFTLVADRPRTEVIQYTAVQGDTITAIAEQFGLQPETVGWSNPRRLILALQPGNVLNIPPADGVYFQAVGSRTIADYATIYKISDPYLIIDSEFNQISDLTPESVPPSGTWIFVPGGQGEEITWTVQVEVETEGPRRGYVANFAPGDPGSCGNVQNPGGGAFWGRPMTPGSYTITRGYSSIHTGIDLAAPPGTPVFAANSGVVVFAGWSTFGYGNMIVLAHGPFLTLYGHLSQINVRCGQLVGVGQSIGGVGNTGNSSGPHLHFEIRDGFTPRDPSATIGF